MHGKDFRRNGTGPAPSTVTTHSHARGDGHSDRIGQGRTGRGPAGDSPRGRRRPGHPVGRSGP
ncbi:hypothetical protein EEB14_18715 [Rhodococcus sp. WS4]|nr:hypothetical protein EEB14_18715 [Rhodococcus sp. WS4]